MQHTPGDERQMMGEAPHVEFQFRVDVGTIHDIVLLFRQRFPKLPPCLVRQHQLLRAFQHTPTHGAAILGVHTLLPKESDDILIHPLLVRFSLLAQVVHDRAAMLPIIIEWQTDMRHLSGKVAQAYHQVEILTIADRWWRLQMMLRVQAALGNTATLLSIQN